MQLQRERICIEKDNCCSLSRIVLLCVVCLVSTLAVLLLSDLPSALKIRATALEVMHYCMYTYDFLKQALGAYYHARNISFAAYTAESATTCGGYPASAAHEELDAETFARAMVKC